jgi:hypothetical protein
MLPKAITEKIGMTNAIQSNLVDLNDKSSTFAPVIEYLESIKDNELPIED